MLQSEDRAVPAHSVLYWPDLAVSARKAKRAGAVLEKSSPRDAPVNTATSLETCREVQVSAFALLWVELSVSSTPMLHLSQGTVDIPAKSTLPPQMLAHPHRQACLYGTESPWLELGWRLSTL